MKVIARLITACGCLRDVEIDGLTPLYRVPMMTQPRYAAALGDTDRRYREIPVRDFKLDRTTAFMDGILAEYREVVKA